MSIWETLMLIALVLGLIWGNIMLVKRTANMTIPDSVIKAVKARNEKNEQKEMSQPNEK